VRRREFSACVSSGARRSALLLWQRGVSMPFAAHQPVRPSKRWPSSILPDLARPSWFSAHAPHQIVRRHWSVDVLPQLGIAARRFDIVYVDASHRAADVYADGALAWPMVEREGIVIFDDYEFDEIEDESEQPKLGIDAFLKAVEGQYRLIHKAYQVVIAKL
jgi:Methyltransferase domain